MPIPIRQVTVDDVDAAATTLAEAFADDPVKAFLIGERTVPVDRSVPFFRAFIRIHLPHGSVWCTDDLGAVAVWAPPDRWKVPVRDIVRNSPVFLRLYGRRFLPNLAVLTDLERAHPSAPHHYLEFIGTAPRHQGKGYGTALVRPMVERADAEGVGMYLESSKESNVPFYGRFGFQVSRTLDHRRNGPRQWLMWRDPS